jgi:hypothetical protein
MTNTDIENCRKLYKERIQKFIDFLNQVNAKWITKRAWFTDLHEFELGKDFFSIVFSADEDAPADKDKFYKEIFIEASTNAQEEFGEKDNLECGLEIEKGLDKNEKECHQKLLDYLWWITIFKMNKNEFNSSQKAALEDKRKIFANQMKTAKILA